MSKIVFGKKEKMKGFGKEQHVRNNSEKMEITKCARQEDGYLE